MQPIIVDRLGQARFQANELVQWMAEPEPLSGIIKYAEKYCEQADLDQALQLLGVPINHESLSAKCRAEARCKLIEKAEETLLPLSYSSGYNEGFDDGYEQAKHDILSALDTWKQEQLEKGGK